MKLRSCPERRGKGGPRVGGGNARGKGWIFCGKFERKDLLPTLRGEILNLSGGRKKCNSHFLFRTFLGRGAASSGLFAHTYRELRPHTNRDGARHTCSTYSSKVYDSWPVYPRMVYRSWPRSRLDRASGLRERIRDATGTDIPTKDSTFSSFFAVPCLGTLVSDLSFSFLLISKRFRIESLVVTSVR